MIEIFRELNTAYKNNEFEIILVHQYGNYFLKLRSLSRAQILRQLAERAEINIENVQGRQLFEYMFCQNIAEETINDFINDIYKRERVIRKANEENLYNQLHRLEYFNWGGFHQNNVEKTIVNSFVKKNWNLNELERRIENDLAPRIRNYVVCSWYNHWSSILIEDMFRDHEDILPAVGLVKKVDFFWNDFPFDLKVTYFPEGYLQIKRSEKKLPKKELSELKKFGKRLKIKPNKNTTKDEQFRELLNRLTEYPTPEAQAFIQAFHQTRRDIINDSIANPQELIVWFYENQGTRRFDAANRFFIVLIDRNNLEESWKLKRNKEILSTQINDFLNANRDIDFNQFQLNFNWEGENYQSYAICIFIIRE